ncbi:hypothetical protein I4U23_013312 [Adineta vaga]|nr:hypothetical protein I4U23_013312 [Adineta vaga]
MLSVSTTNNDQSDSYDMTITFYSIENISMMNRTLYTDLYFIAKLDDQISLMSTYLPITSTLKWNNEQWIVLNIPSQTKLVVNVYGTDKDNIMNNHLGNFEIADLIHYKAPFDGHAIIDSFGQRHGCFHLSMHSTKSSSETQQLPHYTFDGPCRYSRHESLTIDRFTKRPTNGVSSTWQIQLRRIPYFFPSNEHQPLKRPNKSTFELYTTSHGRTLKANENGRLSNSDHLWKLIFFDKSIQKIKPRIYTYIIDDNTWQFSETGYQFFTTVATKHTVLAGCSDSIRYAGEFHIRPKFGWNRLDDEWEIVFDNASGTFSPNSDLLVNLKKLMLFNFPDLNIITYDYKDPLLRESIEQLELNARRYERRTAITTNRHVFSNWPLI